MLAADKANALVAAFDGSSARAGARAKAEELAILIDGLEESPALTEALAGARARAEARRLAVELVDKHTEDLGFDRAYRAGAQEGEDVAELDRNLARSERILNADLDLIRGADLADRDDSSYPPVPSEENPARAVAEVIALGRRRALDPVLTIVARGAHDRYRQRARVMHDAAHLAAVLDDVVTREFRRLTGAERPANWEILAALE
ncbi:hypothetical protein HUW46_04725 [Amycolatopsis sp. CA-230715]|nr:hypothetical protein HUW46_04725 [Amycolatopsis sp. CA-230715]